MNCFIYIYIYYQSVLPKGRSFTANSGTKATVLSKGRSSTTNSGTKVAVLLGMNKCGSFPMLSVPHSLLSIWTDLKRSEKIPGAPAWRWGEWIWLTGPSGLHRNSPQGSGGSSYRDMGIIPTNKFKLIFCFYFVFKILSPLTLYCTKQKWKGGQSGTYLRLTIDVVGSAGGRRKT